MEGSDESRAMQPGINTQMQNLNVHGNHLNFINSSNVVDSSGSRLAGIPPSHPHSHPHFGPPRMGPPAVGNPNLVVGPSHMRSLSQPSVFSFDSLPQWRLNESNVSGSGNVQGAGLIVGGGGGGGRVVGSSEGLPPRRGHVRSNSDSLAGFGANSQSQFVPSTKPVQLVMKPDADWGGSGSGSGGGKVVSNGGKGSGVGVGEKRGEGELTDDLFSTYLNLEGIDALNSSSMEDKDSRASGTRTNDSSENEVESSGVHGASSSYSTEWRGRGKRSAPGEIASTGRHIRSVSMDSFMGNLNFTDDSPRLPPSPGFRSAQHSPSNSVDDNNKNFNLEIGDGEFSAGEMTKIMANEKLAEIAVNDPKRVKRILSNRQSAARSKERKMRYVAELESRVQTLQTEATTLSAQLTHLQRDAGVLSNQNNELKFRIQAMEQQAQLRTALNEALAGEVQRLKLAAGEQTGAPPSSSHLQVMANNHLFQMQASQYMYQQQQQQQNNQTQQQTILQNQQSQQSQSTKCQQDAKAPYS